MKSERLSMEISRKRSHFFNSNDLHLIVLSANSEFHVQRSLLVSSNGKFSILIDRDEFGRRFEMLVLSQERVHFNLLWICLLAVRQTGE